MKVTIFGSGFVGLVTGACLADSGNQVVCVDVDHEKISMLKRGHISLHEPGLQEIVSRNIESGRLLFTTVAREGVEHGLFLFIAVGGSSETVSGDLSRVSAVAETIGQYANDYKVVVTRSTVPVGTASRVRETIGRVLTERGVNIDFDVASNPGFLKEGAAVTDFMRPDRIIVGTDNPRTGELFRTLYEPFMRSRDSLISMGVESAELTKYAANAMLATKISFMNEVANIAEKVGADIEQVRLGIGADPRIGYHFIYPGCGFGGVCFPKDLQAMIDSAREAGNDTQLLQAVHDVNTRQKNVLFDKISTYFKSDLAGRSIALWGLSFKPNTDDLCEAPSVTLLESLWAAGAKVKAYDPVAGENARALFGDRSDFELVDSAMSALAQADALVLVTEWAEFRSPDFDAMKNALSGAVIFDGRNVYEPSLMRKQGFTYFGIGRGEPLQDKEIN
ncbi:MAG: UDP-glucose/GDP-mannose dehydrogenase family protein [Gammaproteobacteria bacterium]